jgi:Holliday junction DNA helicase RuvB
MAIKSSNKEDIKQERIISPESKNPLESQNENNLRPKMLKDYVGQTSIKKHLMVSISSAKIRKEPLEHILFYGPPGL